MGDERYTIRRLWGAVEFRWFVRDGCFEGVIVVEWQTSSNTNKAAWRTWHIEVRALNLGLCLLGLGGGWWGKCILERSATATLGRLTNFTAPCHIRPLTASCNESICPRPFTAY